MLPNIHILGIQGSGKGTQSALLVEQYHLNYLGSGNLFRERSQADDGFGQLLAKELKSGRLLPDAFLFHTVIDYLANHPLPVGLLGDGVIRTLSQLEGLQGVWPRFGIGDPILIHLRLSETTALERIEKRKAEAEAAERLEHHRVFSGKLLHRSDDNPKALQERFATYHKMTEPIIKYFDDRYACLHLDAADFVETINQEITEYIQHRFPTLKKYESH